MALLGNDELFYFCFLQENFLFAQAIHLRELLNVFLLLLVLVDDLLHLLSLAYELLLERLVRGRVNAGSSFFIQPELLHPEDLLRVGLQLNLELLELGEL